MTRHKFLRPAALGLGILTSTSVLIVNSAHSQNSTEYRYDVLGRLQSAIRTQGTSTTYTYDAAGNRTHVIAATIAADTTPDAFDLGAAVAGSAGVWAASSIVTIGGINAAAPVTISGGQYRINGGAWQTAAGSISAGQTIQVQVQAPTAGGASQTATLSIGGVSDTFQVTTTADTTPNAFDLGAAVTGSAGAWAASSIVTIGGVNAAAPVTISGGQYRINGGAWQTAAGSISAGQTIQVQVQAPAAGGASQTATLSIGGVSDTFAVTTVVAVDTIPNPFSLGEPVTIDPGAWATSATPVIGGINAATPVTISGGEYRIASGAWQTAASTITAGQTIQVRVRAGLLAEMVRSATLTIGSVSATFEVTTASDTTGPCVPPPGKEHCERQ
ncbi:MAG TPA: RHS repeat domain-containing protein [Brevundimonas sp.]|nr:RHS repeat domain-containing protein [Brevundimonas sp.]